jgi:hypothetical protein
MASSILVAVLAVHFAFKPVATPLPIHVREEFSLVRHRILKKDLCVVVHHERFAEYANIRK